MDTKRVVIVTGGVSGLGKAVVKRFSEEGYSVAVIDIHPSDQPERGVRYYEADISNQQKAKQVVNEIVSDLGSVDVLVNSAGITHRSTALDLNGDNLGAVLDVNLRGTFYMCQAVAPFMIEAKGGAIINFASILSHQGGKHVLAYSSSKGGVIQLTKCLAVEWAPHNIRVNAVTPGYFETALSSGLLTNSAFGERVLSRTPMGRFGNPEEVAAVVEFLASPNASFITGVDLPVDGGLLAGDPLLFPPVTA